MNANIANCHTPTGAMQLELPLTGSKESQRERCRRLLAGDNRITTAARTFTEQALAEATRAAQRAITP